MLFRGMIYTRLAHASKEKHALFDQMTPTRSAWLMSKTAKASDGVVRERSWKPLLRFVWACSRLTIVVKTSSSAAAVWKTGAKNQRSPAGWRNPFGSCSKGLVSLNRSNPSHPQRGLIKIGIGSDAVCLGLITFPHDKNGHFLLGSQSCRPLRCSP